MMMTVGADPYHLQAEDGSCRCAQRIYAKIVDSKKIEAVDMVNRMFEREEATD